MNLIPLHTHSVYSILDGMIKIKDYISWGKENNMQALALTDHGVMGGTIKFFEECNKNDIKPILGEEFYMTFDSPSQEIKTKDNYHLILLAKNKQGWLNLIKLHNLSYKNFHHKPRITFEDLEKYNEGLICSSACLGGLLPKTIMRQDNEKLLEYTNRFKSIFKDDFYLEIQEHNISEQKPINLILLQLSKMLNIKVIATNDSHYVSKEDSFAHQVLLCKQTHKKINDEKKMNFGSDEFYLKNTQEMRAMFNYIDDNTWTDILNNINEIGEKVEKFDILQHSYNYPVFGKPEESFKKLVEITQKGFEKRFKGKNINLAKYIERLKYELTTIYKIGFVDYFLLLDDLNIFLDKNNITKGYGRGSGGASLVLYCLGITGLDPIKYNLLFERFINPDRISAPDYDLDVPDNRRQEVVDYIKNKYGEDRVCNIATYGEMTSVSTFKAVASVLDMPFAEANKISKDLLETSLSLKENMTNSPELQKMYKTNELFAKIFNTSLKLEGGLDKRGVHACACVISNQPLENLTPVMIVKDSDDNSVNCASFDMKEIDGKLFLLKLDVLGLKNLTIIQECMNRLSNPFNFHDLDFGDKKTYNLISDGKTLGVFQFESAVMKKLCNDIQPKNLEDLSVINAGARPGALESGLTQSFIDRRKGLEEVDYMCNGMETYLKDTLGLPIFQENIMQLSTVMAGYTMAEADGLRKIIGKKLVDKLPAERAKFISGSIKNEHSEKKANEVFDMIEKFGRYGFNLAHSACYSALSYVTAYLKTNYPLEYMTALLNANSDNLDKLTPYIDECYRMGINVLPPDINKSSNIFEHDKETNSILFGFNGIKGVGESSIVPIVTERKNGNFKSLEDLLNRIPSTNKTTVENLIKCGALNNIEQYLYKYLPVLEFSSKAKNKADYKKGNISYYDCLIKCFVETIVKEKSNEYKRLVEQNKDLKSTKKEDKEKKELNKNLMENIVNQNISAFKASQYKPPIQEIKNNEMTIMGFPISCNPKKEIIELEEYIENTPISEIRNNKDYNSIYGFMGRVKSVIKTRNGSYMLILTDDIDEINCFVKNETYQELKEKLEQPSNYFRIYGKLSKSYNPDKFPDGLKLEGIRYFNTSKNTEIVLSSDQDLKLLSENLTEIKNCAIINSSDINYRLNILVNGKKLNTKIDFWIDDLKSIADIMIKNNFVKVR